MRTLRNLMYAHSKLTPFQWNCGDTHLVCTEKRQSQTWNRSVCAVCCMLTKVARVFRGMIETCMESGNKDDAMELLKEALTFRELPQNDWFAVLAWNTGVYFMK